MGKRHRILSVAVAVALPALVVAPGASAAADDARTYRVSMTNLTAGQPLTPVLFTTHRANVDVFTVGSSASFGLKEIAENGNLAPLAEALGATTCVRGLPGRHPDRPGRTAGVCDVPRLGHLRDLGRARGSQPVVGLDADLHERRVHGTGLTGPASTRR